MGHRSDQGKVWEEVARQQEALGAASGNHATCGPPSDRRNSPASWRLTNSVVSIRWWIAPKTCSTP